MELHTHFYKQHKAAELESTECIISNVEEGLDLLGNLYYQDFSCLILREHHFAPSFFNLEKNFAVELLQKFSNYRMRLIIVGDINALRAIGVDLNDFIVECNSGTQVNFAESIEQALQIIKAQSY